MCGFKIGKGCFIGMKCYFDDLCVDKIVVGDNVTISYGVYFACHGKNQGHNQIVINDGAYIGMRASITARHDIEIGEKAIVGAMSLVNKSVADGATVVGVPAKPLIKNKENTDMNNYKLYKGAWVAEDPLREAHLTEDECNAILNGGGYLVRNVYDFDCGEETSFWYVIKDKFGGMEELSSKKRNQVRKSFKMCDVRMVSREEMLAQGYEVHASSAESYKIKAVVPSVEEYERGLSVENAKTHDYWAAFDKETRKMIAFSINYVHGEICDYETMKAIPSYQKSHYPYYGLLYEMNRYYLEEKGLNFVNDGARSITNHSNVQPFLIDTFNFRKAYCRLNLTYKWWFGIIVKSLYPFRRFIKITKVQAILNMEAMARNEI